MNQARGPNRIVTIRRATIADAAAVARVWLEAWRDACPGIIPQWTWAALTKHFLERFFQSEIAERADRTIYVAVGAADDVVGMVGIGRNEDPELAFEGELDSVCVEPSLSGTNIGRRLVLHAFEAFSEKGYASCFAWVPTSSPARFFFEALGGTKVAERTSHIAPEMGIVVNEVAYGWHDLSSEKKADDDGGASRI